eukprot:gene12953-biopygen507
MDASPDVNILIIFALVGPTQWLPIDGATALPPSPGGLPAATSAGRADGHWLQAVAWAGRAGQHSAASYEWAGRAGRHLAACYEWRCDRCKGRTAVGFELRMSGPGVPAPLYPYTELLAGGNPTGLVFRNPPTGFDPPYQSEVSPGKLGYEARPLQREGGKGNRRDAVATYAVAAPLELAGSAKAGLGWAWSTVLLTENPRAGRTVRLTTRAAATPSRHFPYPPTGGKPPDKVSDAVPDGVPDNNGGAHRVAYGQC